MSHDQEHGEADHDHSRTDGEHEPHGESDHTHDHHTHDLTEFGAAVVTVSSSRSLEQDPAGDTLVAALEDAGHEVVHRELIRDDFDSVQSTVNQLVSREDTDVVVTTGGTGVTPDDVTVEAAKALFEKTLPGFGELFRRRSEEEIGTRVVGTRTTGGIADGVPVFCLPGSENAARLGAEIIVAEGGHLAGLAQRHDGEDTSGEE